MGLLLVRLAVGLALIAQARGKLTSTGRTQTRAYFHSVGLEPAGPLALLTGLVELVAGTLLTAGFVTPLASAAAVGVLVNASAVNAANGWASAKGGAEYPFTLLLVTSGLTFTGAGAGSVDALLGWAEVPLELAAALLGLALLAALPFLVLRHAHRNQAAPTALA